MKDETSKKSMAATGYHKHKRKAGKRQANKGSRKIAKGNIGKGTY
jgi:hypothetical protein|tara:strand:+ start:283 stop:417 length:135 start_codon:yes stop_codon:yes gene_type:complete